MKAIFGLALIMTGIMPPMQNYDLPEIRRLYNRAPFSKDDALLLFTTLQPVESTSLPLLNCYKGAADLMQAKYALSPLVKMEDFNLGKSRITAAFNRDSLNLEMHFIRFSIQNNLPSFLGYNGDLDKDKRFILTRIKACPDMALKHMILNYLSTSGVSIPQDLKRKSN